MLLKVLSYHFKNNKKIHTGTLGISDVFHLMGTKLLRLIGGHIS